MMGQPEIERERGDGEDEEPGGEMFLRKAVKEVESEREEEVELFFDGERPGVQEGGRWSGVIEVAIALGFRAVPEVEVADEERGGEKSLAEFIELLGIVEDGRDESACEENSEESGKDAADSAFVENDDGEFAFTEVFGKQRGNEIAGDDVEDVDADVAVAERPDAEVKEEDGENGDGAEAVDIRTVLCRMAGTGLEGEPSACRAWLSRLRVDCWSPHGSWRQLYPGENRKWLARYLDDLICSLFPIGSRT